MINVQCKLCRILALMLYFVITSTEAKQEAKSMYGTFLAAFWLQIIVFFVSQQIPNPPATVAVGSSPTEGII